MTASLPITTSRSTNANPFLENLLPFAAYDFQIFVEVEGPAREGRAASGIPVEEKTAAPQNLHGEDRRGVAEIDEIDIPVEDLFQLGSGIHELESLGLTPEERREINIRALTLLAFGFRSEQPERVQPEALVQEVGGPLERVGVDHGSGDASSLLYLRRLNARKNTSATAAGLPTRAPAPSSGSQSEGR